MNDILPIFPLRIVVFPDEYVNLYIFEPRYKAMISDCISNNSTFGIVYFDGEKNNVIGAEMKIISIEKKYIGGEMDIKTKAIGLFKMETFYKHLNNNRLYSGAEITQIQNDTVSDTYLQNKLFKLLTKYFTILKINLVLPKVEDLVSFEIANLISINLQEKYTLTTLLTENERLQYIILLLENLIPLIQSIEILQKKSKNEGFNPELN
jgi:ATP-dependent Lon protease